VVLFVRFRIQVQIMDNPDSTTGPLLDPEQIKMLLESGADESIELFNEILGLFEEESDTKLREMRTARETGDIDAFGRSAHALAGSSANIGGRAVWLKAKDMENLCKAGNGQQALSMVPDLEELYRETLVQMHLYVDRIQSGDA
jgi:HPt (histidine-containing phosphotransfer) domain-containing protein